MVLNFRGRHVTEGGGGGGEKGGGAWGPSIDLHLRILFCSKQAGTVSTCKLEQGRPLSSSAVVRAVL